MGRSHHHHHKKKKQTVEDPKSDQTSIESNIAEKEQKDTIDASQFFAYFSRAHHIIIQKDYIDVKDDVDGYQTILAGLSNPQIVTEPDRNLLRCWVTFDDGKLQSMADSSQFGSSINYLNTSSSNNSKLDYNQTGIDVQERFIFPGKAANNINYLSSGFAFDNPFFRADNDRVDVTNNSNITIDFTTGFSVSFWVYFNTLTAAGFDQWLAWKSEDTNNYWGFFIEATGGDKINFHVNEAASLVKRKYDTVLTTGTWYHVVGTYNAATNVSEIYVNTATGAVSTDAATLPTTTNLRLGDRSNGNTTTGFIMDDFRLYQPLVMTSTQVTDLYNVGTIDNGITNPAIVGIAYISS